MQLMLSAYIALWQLLSSSNLFGLQRPHFIGSSVSCAACDACVTRAFALLLASFRSSSDSQSQVLVKVDWFQ